VGFNMTVKEMAITTIQQLPDDAAWEDIRERVNFVAAVRKGLREVEEGKVIPHDKIKEEFMNGFQAELVFLCSARSQTHSPLYRRK
jgi:predicted transcriptional regulator